MSLFNMFYLILGISLAAFFGFIVGKTFGYEQGMKDTFEIAEKSVCETIKKFTELEKLKNQPR